MISCLDLIDGRGPGFPPQKNLGLFFPLKTYYMCVYIYMYIIFASGRGETPDPCHLSGPDMMHTPSDTQHLGLPGGAVGAMDVPAGTTIEQKETWSGNVVQRPK